MIEQLFGSKTRVKLLRLFFSNPNRSFYVREITRKIDEQINSVRRELSNLLSIGIISSDNSNNKLYYEVNQGYEFYKPLLEIFSEAHITAVEDKIGAGVESKHVVNPLVKDILGLGNVEVALFTGRFTRDERSGIDFLLVGDVNQTKLNNFIEELEKTEGNDIRYALMTLSQFEYRMKLNDRFIGTLIDSKKQIIVDKHYLISDKPNKLKKGK